MENRRSCCSVLHSNRPTLRERPLSQSRIVTYALGVGLASLIPIPLADRIVGGWLMQSLYGDLAKLRGLSLNGAQKKTLVKRDGNFLWGCLVASLVWFVKKLIRTLTVVLLVKEVIDEATLAVHRARLVDVAMERGYLPGNEAKVQQAMSELMAKHEGRILNRWLRRMETPRAELPVELGFGAQVMRWLHCRGGGAKLEEGFLQRLEESSSSEE